MASESSFLPDDDSAIITESFDVSSPIRRLFTSQTPKTSVWDPNYVLDDSNSSIYLISNGLIRRTLLPAPTEGHDRYVNVECTQ